MKTAEQTVTYSPGNSGIYFAEVHPLSGRDAHTARWNRALRRCGRRAILPRWRVAGIVLAGTLAPAGSVLVTHQSGYWYTI